MSKLVRDLSLYASTGLTMSRKRSIDTMLAEASILTGKPYKRGMTRTAIGDLTIMLANGAAR